MSSMIGVAIAVPDPWGAELERWRAQLGDPQAESIPAHITLLPPTSLADDSLDEVVAHLDRAAASVAPFDVELRGTGTFRPVSPVVFVALSSGISGCEAVEAAVRRGVLARDLVHPYHPHVTVAHDVPDEALDRGFDGLAGFRARFAVEEIVLYRHREGRWHAVRTFPLAGETAAG